MWLRYSELQSPNPKTAGEECWLRPRERHMFAEMTLPSSGRPPAAASGKDTLPHQVVLTTDAASRTWCLWCSAKPHWQAARVAAETGRRRCGKADQTLAARIPSSPFSFDSPLQTIAPGVRVRVDVIQSTLRWARSRRRLDGLVHGSIDRLLLSPEYLTSPIHHRRPSPHGTWS